MTDKQIQKILEQLENHEKRIHAMESSGARQSAKSGTVVEKQKTLREIIKGRKFKNGQQQIAIIVGYHENVLKELIHEDKIKTEWDNAKMTNKYSKNFLDRSKDELIRIRPNKTCDLTQTGEDFFEKFVQNEPTNPTSK